MQTIAVCERYEVAEHYLRLLRAVMDQCILDLAAPDSLIKLDGTLYSSHEHAHRFLKEGELFYLACDILGIRPDRARDALLQRVAELRARPGSIFRGGGETME